MGRLPWRCQATWTVPRRWPGCDPERGASGEAANVPGRSGESPLVDYVSGKVPDEEMPPRARRERYPALRTDDVALLRAWIDQGAEWPKGVSLAPPKVGDRGDSRPCSGSPPRLVSYGSCDRGDGPRALRRRQEDGGRPLSSTHKLRTFVRGPLHGPGPVTLSSQQGAVAFDRAARRRTAATVRSTSWQSPTGRVARSHRVIPRPVRPLEGGRSRWRG